MQQKTIRRSRLWRRYLLWGCLVSITPGVVGCSSWINRKKNEPDNEFVKDTKRINAILNDPNRPRLIGEVAGFSGIEVHGYDTYGLVDGLHQSGGTVKPGNPRNIMLTELRRKELKNPEQVLDSPSTALVKVKAYSFPGARQGDGLDLLVECSADCTAADLAGGFLVDAYLREVVSIGGSVRTSENKATAKGELVQLPASYTRQDFAPLKAIIIGGGKMLQNRRMSLYLNPDFKHTFVAKKLETAINERFYFTDTKQQLVAEGKSDFEVSLRLPPKYRYDVSHFSSVIVTTGFHESKENQQERIAGCAKLLKDSSTARRAAAELEAIGDQAAIDVLLTGLSSIDTVVRFQSAYSLAYLDRKEATPVLVDLAKKEFAFRPLCLVGLTVMNHDSAREALERLLQDPTPELRYGALWSLRNRDSNSNLYEGERLVSRGALVQIPSETPLIAVSMQTKPEVVVFGKPAPVELVRQLSPSPLLTLTPMPGNQIRIVRNFYQDLNDPTLQTDMYNEVVPGDFISIMRALTYVGANYNEVVQTIEALQATKSMSTPVAFNPRPDSGRIYKRDNVEDSTESVETVAVDNTTRELISKAWWDPSAWLTKSKVVVAKEEKPSGDSSSDASVSQASHSLPITDLDAKAKMVEDSMGSKSASGDGALPDIDWDAIK